MSRDKMFTGPPNLTGTPMERFERVLRCVVSAPKATVDKHMRDLEKKKKRLKATP